MSSGETVPRPLSLPPAVDPSFFQVPVQTDPGAPATRPLFTPDAGSGQDGLDRAGQATLFAELLAHKRAETPFCVAVFGSHGSGKSFFVNQVLDTVDRVSRSAAAVGDSSPFLADILTVRVDAAAGQDPVDCLAHGVFDGLTMTRPRLAREAWTAGGDPILAARDAREALGEARRRLDAERQSLEALRGREARLTDSVLFDATGSRVDAYARRNRSRIDRALRLFGFNSADPVTAYKELVREASEARGPMARASLIVRSLWAYQGQMRLIVWAVILGLVASGASALDSNQDALSLQIRGMGDRAGPTADWVQAHAHWLGPIHTGAMVLALACLAWAAVRAARFLLPIFRGVSLLGQDFDAKRRDIDSLLAHQTRLVDGLVSELDGAVAHADEADRRAGSHKAAGLHEARAPGGGLPPGGPREPAAAFLRSLGAAMQSAAAAPKPRDGAGDLADVGLATPILGVQERGAPHRIVVVIDGLDQLGASAAADMVGAARRLLGPGFVTLLAAERPHLAAGFADTDPALATAQIDRCVQVAYDLGRPSHDGAGWRGYAKHLIEGAGRTPNRGADDLFDPHRSVLDLPWRPREADVVAALAPYAGDAPRAVKRYVNVYRVARADPRMRDAPLPVLTALALGLAFDAVDLPDELAAPTRDPSGEGPADRTLLREGLAAAQAAAGQPIELVQAKRAFEVARHYKPAG